MNIALFGGRFDPPHNSHLAIAWYVLSVGIGIDEVWLLPAHTHPWRPIVASNTDRLAMLRVLENPKIKVKNTDIQRGGQTYTIDTVRELQKSFPHQFFWICGIDQLPDLPKWKDFTHLQALLTFLVIPREGYTQPIVLPKNVILVPGKYTPSSLSSSEIRDKIKQGVSVKGLVPEKVEEYIREKGLYKD
jgi:nicotinate-nucleotide adenylyltransferase